MTATRLAQPLGHAWRCLTQVQGIHLPIDGYSQAILTRQVGNRLFSRCLTAAFD